MPQPTTRHALPHDPLPEEWAPLGIIDFRAEVLAKVVHVTDGFDFHVLEGAAVEVVDEGLRLGKQEIWVLNVDMRAEVTAAQADALVDELWWGALAARALNSRRAIAVPATWTAHPTLRTKGAAILAIDGEFRAVGAGAPWRPECLGVFREVGRIVREGRTHTVLVEGAS
jgi:hypothetical protein